MSNTSGPPALRLAQRIMACLGLVLAVGALVTIFLPFRDLQIQCGPAIGGGKVEQQAPEASFVHGREAPICAGKAHSRLAVAGVAAALGAIIGIAGWFLPHGVPWWFLGDEEEGGGDFLGYEMATTGAVGASSAPGWGGSPWAGSAGGSSGGGGWGPQPGPGPDAGPGGGLEGPSGRVGRDSPAVPAPTSRSSRSAPASSSEPAASSEPVTSSEPAASSRPVTSWGASAPGTQPASTQPASASTAPPPDEWLAALRKVGPNSGAPGAGTSRPESSDAESGAPA